MFYNAYVGNKAATGVGGYYVGNRQLGGTVVGISFFATFASTNTFIGHAGKGYDYGVAWFTMAVLLVIFSWMSWRWIGPPLRRFAAAWDALTIPDYIRGRILGDTPDAEQHPLLLLSASVIVFASILYLLAKRYRMLAKTITDADSKSRGCCSASGVSPSIRPRM